MLLVLFSMCPINIFDVSLLEVVPYTTIIRHILLPEVVSLLIHQDLRISIPDAVDTLRKSQSFGCTMHPCYRESHPFFAILRKITLDEQEYTKVRSLYGLWIKANTAMDFFEWSDLQACLKANSESGTAVNPPPPDNRQVQQSSPSKNSSFSRDRTCSPLSFPCSPAPSSPNTPSQVFDIDTNNASPHDINIKQEPNDQALDVFIRPDSTPLYVIDLTLDSDSDVG